MRSVQDMTYVGAERQGDRWVHSYHTDAARFGLAPGVWPSAVYVVGLGWLERRVQTDLGGLYVQDQRPGARYEVRVYDEQAPPRHPARLAPVEVGLRRQSHLAL